ncbi:MAG: AAA family ATPase [Candidatus Symbiothrix sp.]|jgi:DNA polymerase III delta prime subunit|nr:AAA family ATPase [Candidatus Symbiothrix sp.]
METPISLSQIGLYNPQRQSAEVTEKLFVVRQKQFDLLLESILEEKNDSIPQHYLIVGQRGMGKTTILKRMEVELHKEQYRQQFIPLLFPEEQYNVKDLAEFWINCLDALADSLELEKYAVETVASIDKKVKELSAKEPKTISEESFKFLMNTCRELHRRPVLLVDNIGLVLNRLNKHEQHVLRALLSENGTPIVVSAGITVTDDVINYDMPFFDFFQIQYLKKLRFEEFMELLENLAKHTQNDTDIVSLIRKEQPRLRALFQLTGGNPRTAVILFKLLVKGFSTNINDDLDALVDEVTPLYKAKFEELPQQQQIIIDAIAMNWDAISLNKMATATHFKNNQLSPQLKRLVEEGWIETTPAYKAKGNAYSISERFFNIWFLMRRSNRRKKKEIHYLSKFLESFYGGDLENVAKNHLVKCENDAFISVALMNSKSVDKITRKELENKLESSWNKIDLSNDKLKNDECFLQETLFELHNRNEGIAKDYLSQALQSIEKELPKSTMDTWYYFATICLDLNYGKWLLDIFSEKGFDKILSPYFTAIQAIEIERKEKAEKAEIYLKNCAVEISEPARIIMEKIKKYLN